MKTKQTSIKGVLPSVDSIGDWSELKFVSYLKFFALFTQGDKYSVTDESRRAAEQMNEDFWLEFMVRIDRPLSDVTASPKQFQMRLMIMHRNVMRWLRQNPHAITTDIRALLKQNKYCHLALTSFVEVHNKMGGKSIVQNNPEGAEKLPTPQLLFEQSLMNLSSALNELTSSFKRGELKSLDAETKLKLATNLLGGLQKSFQRQSPNSVVFQKIVVNKANREELEATLLGYADTNQIEQEK
jgi:hypothetical protein